MRVGTAAHTVHAGAEKFIEHIVFVGGRHQSVDGQTHHACHMAGAHIAKVAARHREADLLRIACGGLKITGKVIHHLRQQTRPVDRVDCANFVFVFESQIVGDCLHQILAIVKHTFDGDVVNVFIQQAEHLRLLKGAHAPVWAGHEHTHTAFATHGVFGSTAGVTAGGTKNVQLFTAAREFVFKQIAQQLHGHVFEGQGGAIRQGFNKQALF